MKIDPHSLPDNPEVLRQMVIDLATQLDANERRLFLFAVQLEASGADVQDVIAELEQDQESKPDDDHDPPAAGTADQPAKPRGHRMLLF